MEASRAGETPEINPYVKKKETKKRETTLFLQLP
jgi:hypothetical protein